eukprot:symbB.v1.2.004012.t1/scaffold225.1/size261367/13
MALVFRPRLPFSNAPKVPEDLLEEVSDEKVMPLWAFCGMVLLEIGVWVGMYWRDYTVGTNIAIGHYYSFQTITDLSAFRLPANRRSWWNPFRAIAALAFIFLDVSLLINGAETVGVLPFVRIGLCTLRFLHASVCFKVYGPRVSQMKAFPKLFRWHLQQVSAVPLLLLAWAVVGWFCPYVFILMHYNYGEVRIDGPLTALQDTYVVTVVLKSLVLDTLFASRFQAGLSELTACILFSGQYPLIFDTYWLPPLKMGHLLAEVMFGGIGLLYLLFDVRLDVPETPVKVIGDAVTP